MLIAVTLGIFLGLRSLPINLLLLVLTEIIIMQFLISPCIYVHHAILSADFVPSDLIVFMVRLP